MKTLKTRRGVAMLVTILMASSLLIIVAPPAAACGFGTWYLPEGYTGGNFDTYILVQNPNEWDAEATVRFLTEQGATDPLELELEGNSRTTVTVDEQPGLEDANVSTIVEATSGVVVERAMYFTYADGKAGGSNSIGSQVMSNTWFLAEGYTGPGFDTYVLVMNPNEQDACVSIKYVTPVAEGAGGGEDIIKEYDVPAMTRYTIHVDEVEGLEDTEVSCVVTSVAPGAGEEGEPVKVVAERAMYYDYLGVDGGHASIGAPWTSSVWYLPEGRTAIDYDTFVLVMNPNNNSVKVKASFLVPAAGAGVGRQFNPNPPEDEEEPEPEPEPDTVITKEYTVEPWQRFTIAVDQIEGLAETDVATIIEAEPVEPEPEEGESGGGCAGVVVERAMYFARGNNGDGHNTIGATCAREYWLLAEGYTAQGFDTWVLLMNPNMVAVNVRCTFMVPEGEPVVREFEVAPRSRLTVPVDEIEGLEQTEVSTKVQVLGPVEGGGRQAACETPIVAERAMYFTYNGIVGGHSSMGVGE
ncbi:MAG: hypothetical protein V1748_07650 [Actinomycetota bacterium]